MNAEDMKARTKAFAVRAINLANSLPPTRAPEVMGKQLVRSASSVGANYRSACRAKSAADFVSKMHTVEEEADESGYWIELLVECGAVKASLVGPLLREADEIVPIVVASIRTVRGPRRDLSPSSVSGNPQSTIHNRKSIRIPHSAIRNESDKHAN